MNSPFFERFMQSCKTSEAYLLYNFSKILHNSHVLNRLFKLSMILNICLNGVLNKMIFKQFIIPYSGFLIVILNNLQFFSLSHSKNSDTGITFKPEMRE